MDKGKLIIGAFALAFSLIVSFSLTSLEEKPSAVSALESSYASISGEETLKIINEDKDVLILDVRTPEEFNGPLGHLKGAVLIPVHELADRINEISGFKDKKALVICHSGGRSAKASRLLIEKGFTKVFNVAPGMSGISGMPGAQVER